MPPTPKLSNPSMGEEVALIPSDYEGMNVNFPVRQMLHPGRTHFDLRTHVGISAAYGALEETKTVLMYRVVSNGVNKGAVAFKEIAKDFNIADGLLPDTEYYVKWTIPSTEFAGKENGKLEIWVYSLSSSTGPDFYIGEPHGSWVDNAANNVEGFAFF